MDEFFWGVGKSAISEGLTLKFFKISEGFDKKLPEFLRSIVKISGISEGLNGKKPEFLRGLRKKIVIS